MVPTLATILASPIMRALCLVENSSPVNTHTKCMHAVMAILPLRERNTFSSVGTDTKDG